MSDRLDSPPVQKRPILYTILLYTLAATILAAAIVNIYYRSLTGFEELDDEGYLMIGLHSFLHGKILYDYIYSQYGPFYYLVQAAIYSSLHLEVTHHSVRAIMGAFWALSAALCAWSAYRLTRSRVLTALAFTAAISLLAFFTGSPGHPEETCLALLLGIPVTTSYLTPHGMGRTGRLLGALLAALALTKINIGAFAALAIALALLKGMPEGRKQQVVFALFAAAGIALPVIILAPLLHQEWAQRAAVLVVLSMTSALLVAWHSETEQIVTPSLWIGCVAAFGVFSTLVIAVFLARGTTLSAMLQMTVLQHRGFARNWYIPFSVRTELLPAGSLLIAIAWVLMSANARARGPMIVAVNVIKVLLSVVWCINLRINESTLMYNFVVPFAWLVLVPSTGDGPGKAPFARLALCLLTIFSALYVLPVAGGQMAFSVMLTIPTVCVFLDDARVMLATMLAWRKLEKIVEISVLGLVVLTNVSWARGAALHYRKLTPLALAGAERIHLRRAEAANYQRITAGLKNSCDSNFSMPGIFSLYFWTGTTPPTGLLMDNWMGLLNIEQQQQIVNDLSHSQKLCIVYNPRLVAGWRRGQDLSVSPLARYIHDGFAPSDQIDDYAILVRKTRGQATAMR